MSTEGISTRLQRVPHELVPRIVLAALLLQILLTLNLWLPIDRTFPSVSLLESMPVVYGFGGDLLLLVLLAASGAILWLLPTSRFGLFGFTFALAAFILEDVARLQPWVWLYVSILWLLPKPPRRRSFGEGASDEGRERIRRNALFPTEADTAAAYLQLRVILAGVYVWSGVWKLNPAFAREVVPRFFEVFGLGAIPLELPVIAWLIPLVEIVGGILLLLGRTRRIATIALIVLHLLIILALIVMGWNVVVIPWNISMILLLLVCRPFGRGAGRARLRPTPGLGAAILLFWLLPSLRIAGLRDAWLSGELYSGNNVEAVFIYHASDRANLPPVDPSLLYARPGTGQEFLSLNGWSVSELNVPMYPEERYALRLAPHLCRSMDYPDSAAVRISIRHPFTSRETLVERGCRVGG